MQVQSRITIKLLLVIDHEAGEIICLVTSVQQPIRPPGFVEKEALPIHVFVCTT